MIRYSTSKIKTFESCPLKYKNQYINEVKIEKPVTSDTEFGQLIHEVAEKFNGSNFEEVANLANNYQLSSEYKFLLKDTYRNILNYYNKFKDLYSVKEKDFNYQNENYWIYGKIDNLIGGKTGLISIDYKTAKSANRDRHMFQMRFYNLILSKRLKIPPNKIKGIIYYPRIDVEDKFLFGNDEIKLFEKDLINKIVNIETNTDWSCSTGYHCKWCEYFNTTYCPETMKN